MAVTVWYKVLDACEFLENGTLLTSSRCKNNGNCANGTRSDSPGSFECNCPLGYTGQFCEEGVTGHIHIFTILLHIYVFMTIVNWQCQNISTAVTFTDCLAVAVQNIVTYSSYKHIC